MNQAPRISIVVPIYNMAHYLPRCFASLQAQTIPDWEAILVDDGSPDNSGQICDEWAAKDPRFRVIHKPNGGVCTARNAGINAARAPYILLMDQDDLFSPCMAEAMLATQEKYPDSFITCLHTEEEGLLASRYTGEEEARLYTAREAGYLYNESQLITPWPKLYKKEVLDQNGLRFDETIRDGYEDRPFIRQYLGLLWKEDPTTPCVVLQMNLYYWEVHNPGSVSRSGHQPLKPWHLQIFDGFLTDCLEKHKTPPASLQYFMMEYIQTLAFSISCLPEETREQDVAWVYDSPEFGRMLDYFRRCKFYSVFYLPFKLHKTGLVVRLSRGRLENDAFYWRCYKLFRLLYPGWTDWKGVEAIPRL